MGKETEREKGEKGIETPEDGRDTTEEKNLMYTDSHLSSPSPHGHARPVGKHASGNVHRGQLLEQKLGCIRDMHLGDSVLVVTQSTLEESLLQFSVIPSSLAHIVRQIQGCLSTYATGVIKPQSSQM